jgi:hypothetical protein
MARLTVSLQLFATRRSFLGWFWAGSGDSGMVGNGPDTGNESWDWEPGPKEKFGQGDTDTGTDTDSNKMGNGSARRGPVELETWNIPTKL